MRLVALAAFTISWLLLSGCIGEEQNKKPGQSPEVTPYRTASESPQAKQPDKPKETVPDAKPGLKIYFIDVGFGDSTLIVSDGHAILFDAGNDSSSPAIRKMLTAAGVQKLDVLALSSNAPEHTGSARAISVYYLVETVWHNGVNYSNAAYRDALSVPGAKQVAVEYGDIFDFGKGKITILNPQKSRYLLSSGPDSIAMKVEYGDFCALLFSDSEGGAASGSDAGTVAGGLDAKITSGPVGIACQVIKVGNHGSGNSASFQLLERAKPQIAIISVGPNKDARLPANALIERLKLKGISVLRTDEVGSVWLSTAGNGYEIYSDR